MEILLIPVSIAVFICGYVIGSAIEEPRYLCLRCDANINHGSEFCYKCGAEKDWSKIEKSGAPLPIFLGKWRIKL
ncbi:MAG: hypothetical protein KAS36_07505 [Anaerolineales bacterium]|nr:hypothetical protein [Anaerolineales bacterium]